MKFSLSFLIFFALQSASAQYTTLVNCDFSSRDSFSDLSSLLIFGDNQQPVSTFRLTSKTDFNGLSFQCLSLKEEFLGAGGYREGSSRTSTCIDFSFEQVVRRNDTIILEFDYISEELYGNGEGGRMGIAFIYNYPVGGPQFNDVYNTSDSHPFGQPSYNLRILNGTTTSKQAYLFYGGGINRYGEFEKYDNIWLPGFISAPGGASPGSEPDFPKGPVKICNKKTVSDQYWKHYTWILYPDQTGLYIRNSNEDISKNELLMQMATPLDGEEGQMISEMNEMHSTSVEKLPELYHYFGKVEALRFFFRSHQNAFLANVSLKSTTNPEVVIPTEVSFALSRIEVKENKGLDFIPVTIKNPSRTEALTFTIQLIDGNSELLISDTIRTVEVPPYTESSAFAYSLLDDELTEPDDSLVFKIIEVTGGQQSIIGADSLLTIYVEDNDKETYLKSIPSFTIYPNPTSGWIYINDPADKFIKYDIINSQGRIISSMNIENSRINLGNQKKGMYYIRLCSSDKTVLFKVFRK